MARYYVNENEQSNGDHEVHKDGCYWLTLVQRKKYLGEFVSCVGAVREAKKYYSTADGCIHCSEACHTS
ncbi:hypothetical protein KKA27_03330 [Patescibacteria group bacterium]|nr:hypothetical protein [Patescibacteria group bacterium]MBU2633250.1 hypothetical protein [Patescibacteria group bacterium]